MILGGCIALLLLSGGAPAAEPLDDAVPNTYYKRIIGWNEDPGGLGLQGCQIRGSGMEWRVSYMWVGNRVDWRETFPNKREAEKWVERNCE